MAKSKKKYYVVWQGTEPGIYETWNETQLQIKGYPNAKYKSFKTKEEALAAYYSTYEENITRGKKQTKVASISHKNNDSIIKDSISVDAACSGNPGQMEYQGVETISGLPLFHLGPMAGGTNNIGEFLALVHALAVLEKKNNTHTTIYTDSRTAMAWVRNKKVKTTLKQNRVNAPIFNLIDRALKWLETHSHRNPIVKWDTKRWGEIPADFGRK